MAREGRQEGGSVLVDATREADGDVEVIGSALDDVELCSATRNVDQLFLKVGRAVDGVHLGAITLRIRASIKRQKTKVMIQPDRSKRTYMNYEDGFVNTSELSRRRRHSLLKERRHKFINIAQEHNSRLGTHRHEDRRGAEYVQTSRRVILRLPVLHRLVEFFLRGHALFTEFIPLRSAGHRTGRMNGETKQVRENSGMEVRRICEMRDTGHERPSERNAAPARS